VGDELLIEEVSAHLERSYTVEPVVFHELVSDLVHLDVHALPPTPTRPWTTLVTTGMAQRPMAAPPGAEDYRYAELLLALPPEWPLDAEAFADETAYWPVRLLKDLARLPHEYDTWLHLGHTVPNGDPPEPYAGDTTFCGALVAPPASMPEGAEELLLTDGRRIDLLAVIPLWPDEMALKLKKGMERLLLLFDEHGVSEVLEPRRPSVVPARRGFFRR